MELDTRRHEVRRGGKPARVRPKVFDIILYLVRHRDRAVSKRDLFDAMWPQRAVSESVLTSSIRAAREALGDTGTAQRVIQTVHGLGYRFVAEVREVPDDVAAPSGLSPDPEKQRADVPTVPTVPTAGPAGRAPPKPGATALPLQTAPVAGGHEVAGEHKAVSVLAARLHQGEARSGRAAAEAAHRLRQSWERLSTEVVAALDGSIVRLQDHGFVALFGAPVACEEHAYRAMAAAVRLRQGLRDLQPDGQEAATSAVGLSIGLHAGDVVVGSHADQSAPTVTPAGDAFQRAERLSDRADPGTILLSAEIGQAVGTRAHTRPLAAEGADAAGVCELMGLDATPVRRSVLALDTAHALTRLVGRHTELAVLHALWRQAGVSRGQVVGLVGDPGVGKSRLLLELLREQTAAGIPTLACQCVSYARDTPYYPLTQVLRQACQIDERDSIETAAAKLSLLVDRLGLTWSAEDRHLLLELLQIGVVAEWAEQRAEIGAHAVKTRGFALLRELVFGLARRDRLLLAVEDLHWVDPTSDAWLAEMVHAMAAVPLLLVATYRPGYRPPWIDRSFATQHAVHPLGHDESLALVREALGEQTVTPQTMDTILRKAEGNPLFLEELAYAAARQPGAGTPDDDLPDSVHAVLAARIDRLPAAAKTTLRVAAVAGAEVPLRLLELVTGLEPATLGAALRALQEAELLFEVRGGAERTFACKHALTRDAAYAPLMTEDRQQIHASIARALAEHFDDIAETQPEVLARHYSDAGIADEAIRCCLRGGQLAIERHATVEAISQLSFGLDLLAAQPPGRERDQQELLFQTKIAGPLLMLKGHASDETQRAQERITELSAKLGETHRRFVELVFLFLSGRIAEAIGVAEQMLPMARAQDDSTLLVLASTAVGFPRLHLGQFPAARDALETVAEFYDPRLHHFVVFGEFQGHDPGVASLIYLAHTLWLLGYPQQAEQRAQQAVSLARSLGHPFSLAMALYMDAWRATYTRDLDTVQKRSHEAIVRSDEHDFPLWRSGALVTTGWARAASGDVTGGLAQMRDGTAGWQATGAQLGVPFFCGLTAEVAIAGGLSEIGHEALTQGYAVAERNGEGYYLSELQRLEGELLLLNDAPDFGRVEDLFQQACRTARNQEALSLELRAAISLGRLWQRQGKGQPARDLLDGLYARFTEGCNTHDLVQAKRLIDS